MRIIVTIMMVTQDSKRPADGAHLTADARLSINLAVAQWLRSPRATSNARRRLRDAGVAEDEIERRRRTQSDDPSLAGVLKLAVTMVIARGHLSERDRRFIGRGPNDPLVREIAESVAASFYDVTVAESLDRSPFETIDMQIGDY